MKRTGKRIGLMSLGCILLIAALAAVIASFTLHDGRLLTRATRITEAPNQASPQPNAPSQGAHYLWLSGEQALGLKFEGKHDSASLFNAKTDVRTPFVALNTTLSSITPNGEQHLSPDGKWLLWTGIHNARIGGQYGKRYVTPQPGPKGYEDYRVVATAVDGSRQIERQQGGNLAWLPDSQGWIRLVNHPEGVAMHYFAEVQSFSSPEKKVISLPELTLQFSPPGMRSVHSPIQLLGVLPNNHLLTYSLTRIDRKHEATLYDIALDPKAATVQRCPIPLPDDWSATDMKLSPKGDRLAWKAMGLRKRFPDFLARFSWFARQDYHPAFSLWVSNVDGSNLHEVGVVDAPQVDGWDQHLYDLSWLPDGKHLSFIFEGALWTVPID